MLNRSGQAISQPCIGTHVVTNEALLISGRTITGTLCRGPVLHGTVVVFVTVPGHDIGGETRDLILRVTFNKPGSVCSNSLIGKLASSVNKAASWFNNRSGDLRIELVSEVFPPGAVATTEYEFVAEEL